MMPTWLEKNQTLEIAPGQTSIATFCHLNHNTIVMKPWSPYNTLFLSSFRGAELTVRLDPVTKEVQTFRGFFDESFIRMQGQLQASQYLMDFPYRPSQVMP